MATGGAEPVLFIELGRKGEPLGDRDLRLNRLVPFGPPDRRIVLLKTKPSRVVGRARLKLLSLASDPRRCKEGLPCFDKTPEVLRDVAVGDIETGLSCLDITDREGVLFPDWLSVPGRIDFRIVVEA